jgi:hypothetical protein
VKGDWKAIPDCAFCGIFKETWVPDASPVIFFNCSANLRVKVTIISDIAVSGF